MPDKAIPTLETVISEAFAGAAEGCVEQVDIARTYQRTDAE